jgi:hypothetical protein
LQIIENLKNNMDAIALLQTPLCIEPAHRSRYTRHVSDYNQTLK